METQGVEAKNVNAKAQGAKALGVKALGVKVEILKVVVSNARHAKVMATVQLARRKTKPLQFGDKRSATVQTQLKVNLRHSPLG